MNEVVAKENEFDVVIIGGGPAGLTAAAKTCQAGLRPLVLERSGELGGISRTVCYKGYRFDIGGHRFYTKVRAVENFWHEVLPPHEFRVCRRLSRIYYNRRFFAYPIQAFDALCKLGFWNSVLIVFSYGRAKIFPSREEKTFEQNICNRFGRRLFNTFFKSYTEKVWGIPCDQISSDWANQRIGEFGLGAALKKSLAKRFRRNEQAETVKTLIGEFHYPRLGPGQMWETVAENVAQNGGEIELSCDVERIFWDESGVRSLEIKKGESSTRKVSGAHFLSSMPIRELIEKCEPAAPTEVREAAQKLRYRDFLTVALIINRRELFPDNWIYIHEPNVQMGRIQNFKNWSQDMVPDANKTCLGLEYFCFEGDGLWTMSDEKLIEMGTRELATLGLARIEEVEDGAVVRQAKAYPVYDDGYENALKTVRQWIESLGNLQLIGRNGMHRYNNQDHSMLTAMLAVENICGAQHDLWQVNAEQEYHETDKTAPVENTSAPSTTTVSSTDWQNLNATQPPVPRAVNTSETSS